MLHKPGENDVTALDTKEYKIAPSLNGKVVIRPGYSSDFDSM